MRLGTRDMQQMTQDETLHPRKPQHFVLWRGRVGDDAAQDSRIVGPGDGEHVRVKCLDTGRTIVGRDLVDNVSHEGSLRAGPHQRFDLDDQRHAAVHQIKQILQ